MKLSKDFSLHEFVRSETAEEYGWDNTPNQKHIDNLRYLCQKVLQPIRDFYSSPVVITSGFRCGRLNDEVGGSRSSHHRCFSGFAAADFTVQGISNEDFFLDIQRSIGGADGRLLPYEQIIIEPEWIHISSYRPRRQHLKATRVTNDQGLVETIYSLV
jgi:hypothetical protein